MPPVHRLRPLPDWVFWTAQVAFWLAMFAAGMIVIRAFQPALSGSVWFVGSRVTAAFLFTAALRMAALRAAIPAHLGISKIGLMVGGPLVGAVVITLGFAASDALRGTIPAGASEARDAPIRLGLAARFVIDLTMLAIWSAAYFGLQLVRDQQSTELRAFEAEALAARNELKHLQAQISPHFLFNALNTILACKHSPDDIETITHSLAKYLRFLIRPVPTLEPLGREIDALEDYLTIQSFRFGDRLSCRIECDADIRKIPVLPTIIQPLVENALKHGRPAAGEPLEVTVSARRERDRLFVEVTNTGGWVPPDPTSSTGIGLHTLRRRLFLQGGPDATVSTFEEEGHVRVVIQIPLAPEYAIGAAAPAAEAAG